MADLITAIVASITTGATDVMGAITSIAPVAIPIALAIVAIGVGLKVFKKITGR